MIFTTRSTFTTRLLRKHFHCALTTPVLPPYLNQAWRNTLLQRWHRYKAQIPKHNQQQIQQHPPHRPPPAQHGHNGTRPTQQISLPRILPSPRSNTLGNVDHNPHSRAVASRLAKYGNALVACPRLPLLQACSTSARQSDLRAHYGRSRRCAALQASRWCATGIPGAVH